MAIRIGAPYLYRGKSFLDQRQSIPQSLEDLKNWNTPVPEGFEVCLNGTWYYFDSINTNPVTGHWFQRFISSVDNDDFYSIQGVSAGLFKQKLDEVDRTLASFKESLDTFRDFLLKIDNDLFPFSFKTLVAGPRFTDSYTAQEYGLQVEQIVTEILERGRWTTEELEKYDMNGDTVIDISDLRTLQNMYAVLTVMANIYTTPGTTDTYYFDIGSTTLPILSWSIQKSGEGEQSIKKAIIRDDSPTRGFMSPDYKSWTSKFELTSDIKSDKVYTIEATVGEYNQVVIGQAHFKFWNRTYFGIAPTEWLKRSSLDWDEVKALQSEWYDDGSLALHKFEIPASPGSAASVLIPKDQFDPQARLYLNGIRFEEAFTKELTVTNINGKVADYMLLQIDLPGESFELELREDVTDIQKMFETLQSVLDVEELVKKKLEMDQVMSVRKPTDAEMG